ncbi:hypothetical protein GQ54DRAFT_322730 [Martensiomyces pterosporus]|nr:hypothetical protein GQ54DRAFT_322730 [Martensiomyces pterosporus]
MPPLWLSQSMPRFCTLLANERHQSESKQPQTRCRLSQFVRMPETRGSITRAQGTGQQLSSAGHLSQQMAGQATVARAVTPAAPTRPAAARWPPVPMGNIKLMGPGRPTTQIPPVSIQAVMATMGEMSTQISSPESTVRVISQAVKSVQEYQKLVEMTSSQNERIEQLEKELQQLQETSKREALSLRKERNEWKTKATHAEKKAQALDVQIREISRKHTENETEFQEGDVTHSPEAEQAYWNYKTYAAAVRVMPPNVEKAYSKVITPPSEGLMTVRLSRLRGKISAIRAVLADHGLPTRAIVNIDRIQMNQVLVTTPRCYTTELMEAIMRLRGVKYGKENTKMFEESSLYTKEELERIRHRIETNLSIRVASIWHAQPAIRVQLVEAATAP